MSFTSYLKNLGIDVAAGLVGLLGLLGAAGHFIQGNSVIAVVFLVVGVLSLLFTRYRAQWEGKRY